MMDGSMDGCTVEGFSEKSQRENRLLQVYWDTPKQDQTRTTNLKASGRKQDVDFRPGQKGWSTPFPPGSS